MPNSLILSHLETWPPHKFMLSVEQYGKSLGEPNNINSVLSKFILSLSWFIQSLIDTAQFSRLVIQHFSWSQSFALKDMLIEWSSVNPFRFKGGDTTNLSVLAYAE